MKIKTIDITAKEWFDKVNGNSYFSARCTINYGMEDEKIVIAHFQYGYGDMYLQAIKEELVKFDLIVADKYIQLPTFCREKGIIIRYNKIENCKQRDVKEWGTI